MELARRYFDRIQSVLSNLAFRKELLLILFLGIITIAGVDTLLVQKLQKEQEYRQTLMAQQLQAEVQSPWMNTSRP